MPRKHSKDTMRIHINPNEPMDLTTGNAALSVVSAVAATRSGTEAAKTKSSFRAFTPTALLAAAIPPVASHRGRWAMKPAQIFYLLILATAAQAQQSPFGNREVIIMRRTEIGDSAEPLELKIIEPSHFWIYVKWPEKLSEKKRIVNGREADAAASAGVTFKMIQPEYIEPQFSRDKVTLEKGRKIYFEGLEALLGRNATFRVTVTSLPFSGPGQQMCVFSFGQKSEDTLQYKMVRAGYAVVRGSDPTPISETLTGGGRSFDITVYPKPDAPSKVTEFSQSFLNRLLAAQEEARREKLGVWSKTKEAQR